MAKDGEKKKGFFGRVYNVSKWMNTEALKEQGDFIADRAKRLRSVEQPSREETFEQAMVRMNLTEQDIIARLKETYRTGWIFLGISIIVFAYGIYVAMRGYWSGLLITTVLSAFGLVLAYRESFWYCQMKKRKLGCTFNDWLNFILGRG